ncbi:MAG: RNA-guided endonuclease IscB, partial [Candidatus Hermodarchaeota archaeon]
MVVFVLDKSKRPLMPCTEKRARKLLGKGRAVVHRMMPFTIRLKDRTKETCTVQQVRLKIDPGAKVTGLAVLRPKNAKTKKGITQASLLWGAELHHKADIKGKLDKRRLVRRSRRRRKCRYRAPRFDNRPRKKCVICGGNTPKKAKEAGRKNRCRQHDSTTKNSRRRSPDWIPPSLRSRAEQTCNAVTKLTKLLPITAISLEYIKFDTQLLEHPDIQGVMYQQGTLQGYEVKEYLLEKYNRTCAYCQGASNDPILEVEHVVPKNPKRGQKGTDRISNLVLACSSCNKEKGHNQPKEWLEKLQKSTNSLDQVRAKHIPQVLNQLKRPLKAAAFLNSTRWYVLQEIRKLGLLIECGTGALTKYNRKQLGLPKSHVFDAASVGPSTPKKLQIKTAYIDLWQATGRGARQMARVNKAGFPRGHRTRTKNIQGFQTGDIVRADIPKGKYIGQWLGRVAIRASGYFDIKGLGGTILCQGISYKYCRCLQQA